MMKPMGSIMVALILLMVALPVVAEEENPNYILDVKVGEWVQHKIQGGMEMKQTVIAVNEKEATVRTETFMDGKSMFSSESKMPLKSEMDQSEIPEEVEQMKVEKPKISHGKTTVNGKEIDCMIIEYDSSNSKMYLSEDIPLTGMIKMEVDGKLMMELVDYGTDGK